MFININIKNKRKPKIRQLYYSSHYDRCIYQYYSYLLNEKYNPIALNNGINNVAIAYRTNLCKNNIHFAKEAFDFIKNQKSCFIIVGDFKDFFDNLCHKYLKKKLCELLNTKSLSDDYYAVFKNITHYSYVDLTDLIKYYNLEDTLKNRRKLNKKKIILPIQTLRKKPELIHYHNEPYGIPQGSAISATLSNVYMLDFDKQMNNYVSSFGGKYLRYSDDTIFIFPMNNEKEIEKHYNNIMNIVQSIPRLILQREKTKVYTYSSIDGIKNIDTKNFLDETGKNIIDYLGFSFDGKNITIRDKTISKYYYRMYKKINTIIRHKGVINGKIISCEKLYKIYTLKGAKVTKTNNGNFLSYAKKCSDVFGKNKKVSKILHTHYGKIRKQLNKIKEIEK